jgi:DNA-binding response OmpR family regulator
MARILLVDDERHILELYSMELSGDGHDVHTTDSGFDLMGRIDFLAPDLVILDIRLVDFDGLELLREVRERHPDLPVILCSAYDSYRHDARAVAADHYVVKSFDLRELKRKIQRSLEAVIPVSAPSRLEVRRGDERLEVEVQGR